MEYVQTKNVQLEYDFSRGRTKTSLRIKTILVKKKVSYSISKARHYTAIATMLTIVAVHIVCASQLPRCEAPGHQFRGADTTTATDQGRHNIGGFLGLRVSVWGLG